MATTLPWAHNSINFKFHMYFMLWVIKFALFHRILYHQSYKSLESKGLKLLFFFRISCTQHFVFF